jgi:hypothetical protein
LFNINKLKAKTERPHSADGHPVALPAKGL